MHNRLILFISFFLTISFLHTTEHNQVFVFSHGFGGTAKKAKSYINSGILPADTHCFNYQDAAWRVDLWHGIGFAINLWNSCIGQKDDVETFYEFVKNLEDDVWFGESRGGSALLNLLGSNLMQHRKQPKAVICDSPFDSILHVIAHRAKRWCIDKLITAATIERYLPYFCRHYNPNGMQPIDSVERISIDVPLLLIGSRQDTQVPFQGVVALYTKLRQRGHTKVHFLALDHGVHGWLMSGKNKELYVHIVHAFLAHYNIKHNPVFAQAGMEYFLTYCQPDPAALE